MLAMCVLEGLLNFIVLFSKELTYIWNEKKIP